MAEGALPEGLFDPPEDERVEPEEDPEPVDEVDCAEMPLGEELVEDDEED